MLFENNLFASFLSPLSSASSPFEKGRIRVSNGFIEHVVVNEKAQRIDIYVGHEPDIRVRCPECGAFYGMYDHAPERVYRHLNTCQMETYIHARPPRLTGVVVVGEKVILRSVPYWREYGTEKWIEDEYARYLCPGCGHKLLRDAKRCNKCGIPVDLY